MLYICILYFFSFFFLSLCHTCTDLFRDFVLFCTECFYFSLNISILLIQFYYLIWIMVGLTVLLFHWLSESRFGRALNCIKEDDTAAEGCGMDVAHLKLMAFVIGAFWAGMAGNLFAAKMTIISPSSFTFWESVVVFAVVILSGGSQIGVLLGTFLIVALPEMFRDFASARMLVFGLAMMIMMVVRPQGLLPPSPRRYDVRRLLRRTRDFSSPVAPRTARKEGAA